MAAGFVRLCHILLHNSHFLSMYVDDELSLFPAASATLMACVEVMLACSLGIPLSWKKMSLGTKLKVDWLVTTVRWSAVRYTFGGQSLAARGRAESRHAEAVGAAA